MRMMNGIGAVFGMIAVLTLGACTNMNTTPYPPNPGVASSGYGYSGYGVVQSIELVQQENNGIGGSGVGLGTLAGAVIGGVVGNQVGAGRGNTVATVAGVAGGAYVGHELENRNAQRIDAHRITLRMEDGSTQVLMQNANSGFRVGDRVRLDNGNLQRY